MVGASIASLLDALLFFFSLLLSCFSPFSFSSALFFSILMLFWFVLLVFGVFFFLVSRLFTNFATTDMTGLMYDYRLLAFSCFSRSFLFSCSCVFVYFYFLLFSFLLCFLRLLFFNFILAFSRLNLTFRQPFFFLYSLFLSLVTLLLFGSFLEFSSLFPQHIMGWDGRFFFWKNPSLKKEGR